MKKLSWKATKSEIETRFAEYGNVQSIRVPQTLSKDHHDGIAFVVYEESAAAYRALEANQTMYHGRVIEVSMAQPRARARVPPQIVQRTESRQAVQHSHTHNRPNAVEIQAKTLGVMNLADTVNEAQLRALFVPFGSLRRVVLRPDHAGAIVEYDDPADAGTASLALSGREIGHKVIQIGSYEDLMQQKSSQNDEKRAPTNLLLAPRQARTAQARRRVDVRHSATKQKKNEDVATQQAVDDQLRHEGGKKQDFFRALINKDSTTTEPVDND